MEIDIWLRAALEQVEKDLFLIKFIFQSMRQTQENLEKLATNATMTRTKGYAYKSPVFSIVPANSVVILRRAAQVQRSHDDVETWWKLGCFEGFEGEAGMTGGDLMAVLLWKLMFNYDSLHFKTDLVYGYPGQYPYPEICF